MKNSKIIFILACISFSYAAYTSAQDFHQIGKANPNAVAGATQLILPFEIEIPKHWTVEINTENPHGDCVLMGEKGKFTVAVYYESAGKQYDFKQLFLQHYGYVFQHGVRKDCVPTNHYMMGRRISKWSAKKETPSGASPVQSTLGDVVIQYTSKGESQPAVIYVYGAPEFIQAHAALLGRVVHSYRYYGK
jgi:hypothetical protein